MRKNHMIRDCDHTGFHSGVGRLAHDFHSIRFVLICDDCGQEMREVHVEDYSPAYDASGGDAHGGRRAA